MKNLSIGKKLILGFLLIVLLTAILGYISYRGVNILGEVFNQIEEEYLPSVNSVKGMQKSLKDIRINQEKHIFNQILLAEGKSSRSFCAQCHSDLNATVNQNVLIDGIEGDLKSFEMNLTVYGKIPKHNLLEKSLWQSFNESFIELKKTINDLASTMRDPNLNAEDKFQQLHTISKELEPIENKTVTMLDSLVLITNSLTDNSMSSSKATILSIKIVVISLILAVIVFVILIGFYITVKAIKEPVDALIRGIQKAKDGDLTYQMEQKSNDEMGQLTGFLNDLTNARHKNIEDIIFLTDKVCASSMNLKQTLQSMDIKTIKLISEMNTTSNEIGHVTENLNSLATATEQLSSSIKEISKNAISASNIANDSSLKAQSANEVVKKLWERSNEIGNIIKVIVNINEETNLLALNATIEAARAGESGKGFAVVANEVKELAKSTVHSTESITNLIKNIQDEVTRTNSAIHELMEYSNKVRDVDNSISAAVEEQTVTTSEITKNLSDASTTANSVNSTAIHISEETKEYSASIVILEKETNELYTIAKELGDNLKKTYKL